ncbi:YCF48-related protein [Hymenobacter lucidus]|uniref:T9SS type A sorting domain-containing protein n=1 Tax=Hymenobacter lucidus TaxID=2880930 RepID=A0ABS8ASG5_9BACT|nr:T9SS type A sorting domain-containing protein [Hymenobacter lucidus]MCB2409155.1 T9SS type A sorting domain-containing protein [Hymenobacter lucidus]
MDFWALDNQRMWMIQLANSVFTLQRTTTGINGFIAVSTPPIGIAKIRFFSPTTGIYLGPGTAAATTWKIYRTTDAGATWTLVSNTLPRESNDILTESALVGSSAWLVSEKGQLLRTTDAGLTWSSPSFPLEKMKTSAAFLDENNGLAMNEYYGNVARTTDGGATWQRIPTTGNTPVRWGLTAIPGTTGTYIARGMRGLYQDVPGSAITTDNGATWQTLENTYVHSSSAAGSPSRIYSVDRATGNILKATGLPLSTAAAKPVAAQLAWPNPSAGRLYFEAQPQVRTITLLDATGRRHGPYTLPAQATTLDLTTTAPGLYVLQCASGNQVLTQRVVLTAP